MSLLLAIKRSLPVVVAWSRRAWARWGMLLFSLFFLLVLLPAFTLAPVAPAWAPEAVQNWAFDARLLIGRPLTTATSLKSAVYGETRFHFADDEQYVTIPSGESLLAGTLYQPAVMTNLKNPAILLLHGSTPQGRKLGLYRLLGHRLAEQSYVVLKFDLRGFGESDDPPDVNEPESFNFVADVEAAATYLSQLPGVDPEQLYLIGHSFGGDVAITAVAEGAPFQKLVLIGPGRRFIERGGSLDAPELDYFRRRDMRYQDLSEPIPAAVYLSYRATLSLELI
jgi:pimeloyl-ACP methyl ester carboxylesterase